MLKSTLSMLRCPMLHKGVQCFGSLMLHGTGTQDEIVYGSLRCEVCESEYPILEGVAILVPDVRGYLLHHVKGISKFVADEHIPEEIREEYQEYRDELEEEHIEEDLESDRVNALYLMNHYLTVEGSKEKWWKSVPSSESPAITELIEKYWDHGPFSLVSKWVPKGSRVVEIGCGVGGLYRKIQDSTSFFLGVDSSFLSIMIARHLNLGTPYPGELRYPSDLLFGNLSQKLNVEIERGGLYSSQPKVDFVVGEIDALPVVKEGFDVSISLNAIDMLDEPKHLPEAQARVTKMGGVGIQSGPYIWHEKVARGLRGRAPKDAQDSASVVEWLYRKAGFEIEQSEKHIPWLFFKHLRQMELYSVHAFAGKKKS